MTKDNGSLVRKGFVRNERKIIFEIWINGSYRHNSKPITDRISSNKLPKSKLKSRLP